MCPGPHKVLFFCVPADEYGWRQFLLVEDDDHIITRSGDSIGRRLIGYMEEFQRVAGNFDLKAPVGGGDGADLPLGNAYLDIFDGFALLDPPSDGNAFLCR